MITGLKKNPNSTQGVSTPMSSFTDQGSFGKKSIRQILAESQGNGPAPQEDSMMDGFIQTGGLSDTFAVKGAKGAYEAVKQGAGDIWSGAKEMVSSEPEGGFPKVIKGMLEVAFLQS